MRVHGVLTVSFVSLAALAACRGRDEGAGAVADSAIAAMAAPPAASPGVESAASSAAPGALSDANIVYLLDQANAADSALGRLAESKGTSVEVQRFGRLMAGEHHALRQGGRQLAAQLGVTPAKPAGDQTEAQATQEMDSLSSMPKGKAWDRAYIDHEIGFHEAVLKTATAGLGAAQSPQLKDLIRQAAPIVQHHLDRARQIQRQLGG